MKTSWHVFTRGDIPEVYWDQSRTPTAVQLMLILELINKKYLDDENPYSIGRSNFQWAMDAIDLLGDSRWLSTEEFIDAFIQLPDLEDIK